MITTKNTLKFLIQLADALAAEFGSNCEVTIHDLTKQDLDNSLAYIVNGHITKRNQGDGPSAVVVEALSKESHQLEDKLSYLTTTKDGRILKSSTIYVRGEGNQVQYILGINFDITRFVDFELGIKDLIATQSSEKKPRKITNNVNDLLEELIESALELVHKPVGLMNKSDKVEFVRYLNDAGAFLITKSSDKVAKFLGISKFTLYSYLDICKMAETDKETNKNED